MGKKGVSRESKTPKILMGNSMRIGKLDVEHHLKSSTILKDFLFSAIALTVLLTWIFFLFWTSEDKAPPQEEETEQLGKQEG